MRIWKTPRRFISGWHLWILKKHQKITIRGYSWKKFLKCVVTITILKTYLFRSDMVVCMNKMFARFLKKADIDDENFNEAIVEIVHGKCISLGHKLYKKRIASPHKGKRSSYRSILYYRSGDLMVFMYLFAKNDLDNITSKEMDELVQIARLYDTMHGKAIEAAITENRLMRWNYEPK